MNMKLEEFDSDEGFFEHSSAKVDKSVGYLIAVVVVAIFFCTFLFGITQIHSASSKVVGGDHSLISTDEPFQEIGDSKENREASISRINN